MMTSAGRKRTALASTTRGARAISPRRTGNVVAAHTMRRLTGCATVSRDELEGALGAAARHACDVDRDARFPTEALAALRDARLLSALVPLSLGGREASLKTVVSICEMLARSCASSAMIFAIHQAAVASVLARGDASAAQRELLERLSAEQLLLAVADTICDAEMSGSGGEGQALLDIRDERFTVTIEGTTIPYGAYADGLVLVMPQELGVRELDAQEMPGDVAPASRSGSLPPAGGALVTVLRDQYELDRRESWDALGMRGLCSDEFRVVAHGGVEQMLPAGDGDFAGVGVRPVAQLLHSAVWVGIAADALERAQACFRTRPDAQRGQGMPNAVRLSEADALLQMMRAHLSSAVERAAIGLNRPRWNVSLAADMSALKMGVSRSALALVNHAMMICGMEGYRNDTDVSVARHLRDLYAAPLAIDHDRSAANWPATMPVAAPVSGIVHG